MNPQNRCAGAQSVPLCPSMGKLECESKSHPRGGLDDDARARHGQVSDEHGHLRPGSEHPEWIKNPAQTQHQELLHGKGPRRSP